MLTETKTHTNDGFDPYITTKEKEELFEEDHRVLPVSLVPTAFPARLPGKHEIRMHRAELIERLTGELGALRTLILMKLIEKLIADREEGIIQQIKDDALAEFTRLHPDRKTAEMHGATVSRRGKSWYEYPEDVNVLEVRLKELEREFKARKKEAEISGRARKMTSDAASISVSF